LNTIQTFSIDHLKELSDKYQKLLTANTRKAYLESYIKMLTFEIENVEVQLQAEMKILKKKNRFLTVKKFIKGAFDIDRDISQIESSITSKVRLISEKYKEIDLDKYEKNVIEELIIQREQIIEEYTAYFELCLDNFQSNDPKTHSELINFDARINELNTRLLQSNEVFESLTILKNQMDDLYPLLAYLAYGYSELNEVNISHYGSTKKMTRLANEIQQSIKKVWSNVNFSHCAIYKIEKEKVLHGLQYLVTLNESEFFLKTKNAYQSIDIILNVLRVRLNNDFKNVKSDIEVLSKKLKNNHEQKKQWFKRLYDLA
jgi:hypothetical protein